MKNFINITLSLFLLHLYIYINDVASKEVVKKNNNLRNVILNNSSQIENEENLNTKVFGNDFSGWEFGGGVYENELTEKKEAQKEADKAKKAEELAAKAKKAAEEAALYDRISGWEFGGGAPENKKEENILKHLFVSTKDKENISNENDDTLDESEEQIEEIGEIEEIQENEESNEEETESEINENEEESSEEEEKEEEKDEEKEQRKEEKPDEQSKENEDQSTDMKAQNIISENYKNYNKNVKEAAETIMKTLVGLFSGNNEMDSTLKGLAEEISQYFKNH
ncbi:merozoite surface protein 3 [Plasmodium sp. DRC-Itaito]|nr:merozoite surface protein 3 [Plasmodium sp. DRC-Itaito]